MATSVSFNGATYSIPVVGERQWGTNVSNFLIAVAGNALSKAGGSFVLTTADVNFGTSYGLVVPYIKNSVGNIAASGVIRFANDNAIAWRNAANNADLPLKVNSSNILEFNGVPLLGAAALTASRALQSSAGGVVEASAVTSTELARLSGVGSQVDGINDTRTLTNKTLTRPVVDQIDVTQGASATTPAAGKSAIYVNSGDSKLHVVDSSGNDVAVGGGSSGINYYSDFFDSAKDLGTLSTLASTTANLVSLTASYADATSGSSAFAKSADTSLRGANNYLTAVSGSNTNGSRFVQLPAQQLNGVDLGKPISISFDVTGVTTDGNWDAVIVRYNSSGVYQNTLSIAGNVSSASAFPSAKLPTGTTTFNGFFVPDSTTPGDIYALRLRSLANAVNIRIDTLIVGPQPARGGGAITDWQLYTPASTQGFGTVTASEFWWRRNGDSIDISGRWTNGTVPASTEARISLPNSYTIGAFTNTRVVGRLERGISSAAAVKGMTVLAASGITYLLFGLDDYTTGASPLSARNSDGFCGTGEIMSFFATGIPITGWSSNITMADRALEEYLWNSATADSSDTASFGYGPAGVLFGSFTTSTRRKRIRSTTTIQPTDQLIIEVQPSGTNAWYPHHAHTNGSFLYTPQNAAVYGIYLETVSATDIDVSFAPYARTTGASYGSAGEAWSTYSTWRWRVRKVSGGAQVGYPISSSNIIYQETCNVITGTATVSASPTNVINLCNSGSAFTITISAIASTPNGTILRFKNIGAGNVTLDPNASETIDGQTTWPLSQYSSVELIAFNGAWYVL